MREPTAREFKNGAKYSYERGLKLESKVVIHFEANTYHVRFWYMCESCTPSTIHSWLTYHLSEGEAYQKAIKTTRLFKRYIDSAHDLKGLRVLKP